MDRSYDAFSSDNHLWSDFCLHSVGEQLPMIISLTEDEATAIFVAARFVQLQYEIENGQDSDAYLALKSGVEHLDRQLWPADDRPRNTSKVEG